MHNCMNTFNDKSKQPSKVPIHNEWVKHLKRIRIFTIFARFVLEGLKAIVVYQLVIVIIRYAMPPMAKNFVLNIMGQVAHRFRGLVPHIGN